jgi:predicted dehydrogenase
VQELVKNGALGALKLIRGAFSFVLDRPGDVRLDPAMGGGSIWDIGCYPISYARTVAGEAPREVFGWQITGPTGIDETFVGQMRFEHDVYAQFTSSFALPFRTFMEVEGSEGRLSIPDPFKPEPNAEIYLTRGDQTETIRTNGRALYLGEIEDMADAILLGRDPRISLDDSCANVAVITALLESARLGKSVPVTY